MTIDLHGMRENEAIGKIEMTLMTFSTSAEYFLEIITGNGIVLKSLAIDIVEEHGYMWSHPNGNMGAIVIKK